MDSGYLYFLTRANSPYSLGSNHSLFSLTLLTYSTHSARSLALFALRTPLLTYSAYLLYTTHPACAYVCQEFTSNGVYFTYMEPPPATFALLPPRGPIEGGTLVMLQGAWRAGALSFACRFGEVAVSATVDLAASSLICMAPAVAAPGASALALSFDGKLWASSSVTFEYGAPPRVVDVLPDISPNLGGLVVEVIGHNFANGSQYECRFGATATVPATFDKQMQSMLCVTPPGLLGRVAVHVSLNGQQFTAAEPRAHLTFYDVYQIDELLPYGEQEMASVSPSSSMALQGHTD